MDFCITNNLVQTVTEPTYGLHTNHPSTLDLILLNKLHLLDHCFVLPPVADHCPTLANLRLTVQRCHHASLLLNLELWEHGFHGPARCSQQCWLVSCRQLQVCRYRNWALVVAFVNSVCIMFQRYYTPPGPKVNHGTAPFCTVSVAFETVCSRGGNASRTIPLDIWQTFSLAWNIQTTFFFFQLLLNRQQRFNPELGALTWGRPEFPGWNVCCLFNKSWKKKKAVWIPVES